MRVHVTDGIRVLEVVSVSLDVDTEVMATHTDGQFND